MSVATQLASTESTLPMSTDIAMRQSIRVSDHPLKAPSNLHTVSPLDEHFSDQDDDEDSVRSYLSTTSNSNDRHTSGSCHSTHFTASSGTVTTTNTTPYQLENKQPSVSITEPINNSNTTNNTSNLSSHEMIELALGPNSKRNSQNKENNQASSSSSLHVEDESQSKKSNKHHRHHKSSSALIDTKSKRDRSSSMSKVATNPSMQASIGRSFMPPSPSADKTTAVPPKSLKNLRKSTSKSVEYRSFIKHTLKLKDSGDMRVRGISLKYEAVYHEFLEEVVC